MWAVALFSHYANHTINFILYLAIGTEFRQEFKQAIIDIKNNLCGICK